MLPFLAPGLANVYREAPTGEVDRYGKPIIARALVASWAGRLEAGKSVEGEAFSVTAYTLYLEPAAIVYASDEVEVRGEKYTVEGRPQRKGMPGWPDLDHVVCTLRHVGPVSP